MATRDTLVVNPQDTLYFDSTMQTPQMYNAGNSWTSTDFASGSEAAPLANDVVQGIGLGFFMPSTTLFGLGEREDTLVLKRTTQTNPYELWAYDSPHQPNQMVGLYGS